MAAWMAESSISRSSMSKNRADPASALSISNSGGESYSRQKQEVFRGVPPSERSSALSPSVSSPTVAGVTRKTRQYLQALSREKVLFGDLHGCGRGLVST